MKKLIALFVLLLGLGITNAQDKKVETKEETIIYLRNKLNEVKEHWIAEKHGTKQKQFIEGLYINSLDSELDILEKRKNRKTNDHNCGDWNRERSYVFNPNQISGISELLIPDEQSLGYLQIKLISKSVKYRYFFEIFGGRSNCEHWDYNNNNRTFTDSIVIPFLKSDPTNFNKLKKAFEHLKKLSAQSDDDTFGNWKFVQSDKAIQYRFKKEKQDGDKIYLKMQFKLNKNDEIFCKEPECKGYYFFFNFSNEYIKIDNHYMIYNTAERIYDLPQTIILKLLKSESGEQYWDETEKALMYKEPNVAQPRKLEIGWSCVDNILENNASNRCSSFDINKAETLK